MTNGYFDSYTPLPRHQNARAEAVNAIFDAVKVGFDGVPAAAAIQQDRVTHCTDTGAQDAYVIAPTYPILSYVAGQHFTFVAVHANTMASTVNVSTLGVKTIKRQDGTDLSAGDIAAGQLVDLRYDGTYFQLMSVPSGSVAAAAASATAAASSATASATSATASAASATQAAASATTAGATVSQWAVAAGTADAITGAFPTTVTSLTDGLILGFRASAANATTTPTFKADGTTAHTITKQGGAAMVAGDIKGALSEYLVRYNLANTRWELLSPSKPYGATTGTGSVVLSASPTITGTAVFAILTSTGIAANDVAGGWTGNINLSAKSGNATSVGGYENGTGNAFLGRIDQVGANLALWQYGGAVTVGSITSNGTSTSYNTSSDARLKENIADAPDAGALIDALRVRSWDWKTNGSHEGWGFVAQEEYVVAPFAVKAGDDDPAEIVRQWGRDDSKLVPLLVKEIQSLRARLTAAGIA